ncbi:ROK family protein [Parapedobacter sp. 10938]|uniref:ROK family protein n=1 Tax=Parapedobacter flavus TaxID=3110225 RepID=UPI002DB871AB|nr:ROK family protein [Parapedobacter sp. 10938]MEC3881349.1 ROK family protein [Parapedobacter sp. 10938]
MTKNNPMVIAADIGGTHITVAGVNTHHWQVVTESIVRHSVDSHAVAKSILSAWATPLLNAARNEQDLTKVVFGIAIPGPFDYENGISHMRNQDKYDNLYGMNIRKELAERIGVDGTHIRFINDAAAFLQGEVFAGGHNGYPKVLGITLGTGLGTAVWEQGSNAMDADLWKTPYLGSNAEEHLVTRWFVRKAAQHGIEVTGLRELLALRNNQPCINDILAEYSDHLLHFIRFFSEREAADRFIIGGNIAKAWDIFRAFSPAAFDRFDIRISQLGEHASLIGAAAQFA